VNAKNREESSPLLSAMNQLAYCREARKVGELKEIVKLLISKGADVNVKDKKGWTPLLLALLSENDNKEIIKLLVSEGADVNAKDSQTKRIPLQFAASKGDKEIVGLLISKGANVNAKCEDFAGKKDWTSLHYAASRNHKEIVELLISKGADVNAKTEEGWTPLDVSSKEEIKAVLGKHGAKTGKEK
jgi:ankyrin repeat protein